MPNAIYFGDHSRFSLRESNVNLKQNVEVCELHATFAERMATKVDRIVLTPPAFDHWRSLFYRILAVS